MARTEPTTRNRSRDDDDQLPGVKKVGDLANTKHRSSVIYGRSGTGKTTLAASWPKPMLYLDVRDEGTDSISDVDGIDVVEIEDLDQLDEIILWLKRHPKKYKSLVIDTMSQLQELAVEEVAATMKKKLRGSEGKRAGEYGTLTKQDWGKVAGKLKSVIIDLRDLPLETVFIAQDRAFNLGDDEADPDVDVLAPEVGPRLMPSVANVLNAAVHNIGNTFIRVRIKKTKDAKGKITRTEVKEYCLRVGPSSLYVTKVRKPKTVKAPDYIVDPSYEDIVAIIKGEY